jgi:glycosyltransferase involved in cell wall biosynthesis
VRILVCASEAPIAPLNGSRLVLRELTARLAARHEVTVLALRRPEQIGPPPAGVRLVTLDHPEPGAAQAWLARLTALARREPVEARRLVAPFAAALPGLLDRERFDVAHVMLGPLAGVAAHLRGLPAVLAPLDAWHLNVRAEAAAAHGPERAWRLTQERAVRRFQAHAYRPYARVVLVTGQDAREVAALDPALRVTTIPNGVDADHLAPPDDAVRDGRRVLFTGALHAPANEQAALRLVREILPRLRTRVPDAGVDLVGRGPGPAVRALAAEPGVRLAADVPDLRPWLWAAPVYACPMAGGTGIKNKLLEAMAAGAPAVASPLACQGLEVRDGEQLRVAGDDEAFAAALAELLEAPALRARVADAARAYVRARHDWDAVARAYESLYEEIALIHAPA